MTAISTAREDTLLRTIDRIYQSVEQPDLWPDLICEIGELIGDRRDFWGIDPSLQGSGSLPPGAECWPVMFLSRTDIAAIDEYARDFGELISQFLRLIFLSTLWPQGNVAARGAAGLRMIQRYPEAFERREPTSTTASSGIAWRKLMAALWQNGRVFGPDSLRYMRLLVPHLDRAARLQMRLQAADLRLEMASSALDQLTLGVLFVGPAGQPLWLNRRAQEIIATSDVLRLAGARGLVAANPSESRSLRALITGAVSDGRQGLLPISRGLEARALLLIAIPLKAGSVRDAGMQPVCGVVFLSDPDRADIPTMEPLRQAFGLTPREAQLAVAVAQGNGLQAAADATGVALTTARTQLQQVFAKTDTRQQAELAALVHRTLGLLRHD
jgi:DNA-binding CsgD family transcriptional regulator/PAS domain-containing protein